MTGTRPPRGAITFVLHSHLPWLAGHGTWPVGEEWLHQAWSQTYVPLTRMLARQADAGRRHLLTLGITPVLAAQLDHPGMLAEHHTWLGLWRLRAEGLRNHPDDALRALGSYERERARQGLADFETHWRNGGSAPLRALADSGVVELLGGPATHPVLPLLEPRTAAFAVETGLADHRLRFGSRPLGLWSPECAYAPGLEHVLDAAGVGHLMLEGPTLQHVGSATAFGRRLGDTDVVAFGRDLEVTYRVWSPRKGYPSGRWYRDFHTYHHESGFKSARVTGTHIEPADKAPYDPSAASAAVAADVEDFVGHVARRLDEIAAAHGRAGHVVAGYDTELFGHWWHEGVQWLEAVMDQLPEAGIDVITLAEARSRGLVEGAVRPEAGTWGLHKDFHVWVGDKVGDLLDEQRKVEHDLLGHVQARLHHRRLDRDADLDSLARHALLALASDWPFMVSHESATDYARGRLHGHVQTYWRGSTALGQGSPLPDEVRDADDLFGHLDARMLAPA